MNIKLYNSLTETKSVFEPLKKGEVSIYICGPTVYDEPHIGNLRPLVFFSVLRNVFTYLGYKVLLVSNITDIDDKIILRAKSQEISEHEISEKYYRFYLDLIARLKLNSFYSLPKVTENIDDIISMIKEIEENGYAYNVDGNVYFRSTKIKNYGAVSHIDIEKLIAGQRIEPSSDKEHPFDFVLWKKTVDGVTWNSPWGKGRPGWHSECVCLIRKYLGNQIDIHGGAFDLKFPHHDNEIAQSCALGVDTLANIFMHVGFVTLDKEKMSKSLGNLLTASEVLDKYGENATVFFLLSAHYRSPLAFSSSALDQAVLEIEKYSNVINLADAYLFKNKLSITTKSEEISNLLDEFIKCLLDDVNIANAFSHLSKLTKELHQLIKQKNDDSRLVLIRDAIIFALKILDININRLIFTKEDEILLSQYEEYKKNKDYENSDIIRKKLIIRGLL